MKSKCSGKGNVTLWERYLTKEIGIEFKACLYFFAILFFYCMYRVCTCVYDASILHMAEMIFLTYAIGYLQVYLLWNFDEADSLGIKEIFGIVLCSGIYTFVSWFLKWFDRGSFITLGFMIYVMFLYFCVYCIYKSRRKIDDKLLNDDLALFKSRQSKESE